jgi:hypothetical protein
VGRRRENCVTKIEKRRFFFVEWANIHRTRNFEGMYTLLVPMSSDSRRYMHWRAYRQNQHKAGKMEGTTSSLVDIIFSGIVRRTTPHSIRHVVPLVHPNIVDIHLAGEY